MKKYILVLLLSIFFIFQYTNSSYSISISEFEQFKILAEQGNPKAQFILGLCYESGEVVQRDNNLAIAWYKLAAEQEDANAQLHLGLYYDEGKGVQQNYNTAFYWFKKSAEKGNADAQYYLAKYYDIGLGCHQDYTEAAYWAEKAAKQGNSYAQFNLATYYTKGEGVQQSDTEATFWYKMAAEQGNVRAKYNLAIAYAQGIGIQQDDELAMRWLKNAAGEGHDKAQSILNDGALNFLCDENKQITLLYNKSLTIKEAQRLVDDTYQRTSSVDTEENNNFNDIKNVIDVAIYTADNNNLSISRRVAPALFKGIPEKYITFISYANVERAALRFTGHKITRHISPDRPDTILTDKGYFCTCPGELGCFDGDTLRVKNISKKDSVYTITGTATPPSDKDEKIGTFTMKVIPGDVAGSWKRLFLKIYH